MKVFFLIMIFLFMANCNKPKTVLICGDHVCINKKEAKQYFEENLSIEVKIIDKKNKIEEDLVELNLYNPDENKKKISILAKKNSNEPLRTLSNEEKSEIIKNIKINEKNKKIAKKIIKKENNYKNTNIGNDKEIKINRNNMNKASRNVVDICTIIKKCNIEEISKFLLNQGRDKDYPDITKR